MNLTDYTYLINKPNAINEQKTLALSNVLDEFPFFQSARALRLKGLYNEDSFKYNYALKVTAAHTTDRSVLFDFITSNSFTSIQKELFDKKADELLNIKVVDFESISNEKLIEAKPNTLEQSIKTSIKSGSPENIQEETINVEERLDLGKPLDFSTDEKHSFQEWLQLSRIKPINRSNEDINVPKNDVADDLKKKKIELINKFIESNPKISSVKDSTTLSINIDIDKEDNTYIMTETLARVYLEQKKYQKAIQAYEILILKYPEKSSFFANRISDIKILQHNNK